MKQCFKSPISKLYGIGQAILSLMPNAIIIDLESKSKFALYSRAIVGY